MSSPASPTFRGLSTRCIAKSAKPTGVGLIVTPSRRISQLPRRWGTSRTAFRDGNGRAMRILLNHVCERSPYRLDFTDLDAAVWNQRSALTMPDRGSTQVHPEEFVDVFKA